MIYALGDRRPDIHPDSFIADSADIIGSVVIGQDVSIWFNTTLRGDNDLIEIGNGSNIQDNSVLHIDAGVPLNIGENVTVGHSVMLHGCTIGDSCLIGIGSIVMNGATIGNNSLVGARSLITEGKSFPPRSLILGSPAKVIRELTDEEVAGLQQSAIIYQEKIARYKDLTPV